MRSGRSGRILARTPAARRLKPPAPTADDNGMKRLAAVLLAALLPGCADDHARIVEARAAFAAFERALFAGDRDALAATLTATSRRTLAGFPLERVAGKRPLTVVGCERHDPQVFVHVHDPNEDRRSTFVVVREAGCMRVDLLATAEWNQVPVEHAPGAPRFRIDPLPEAERARILAEHAPR